MSVFNKNMNPEEFNTNKTRKKAIIDFLNRNNLILGGEKISYASFNFNRYALQPQVSFLHHDWIIILDNEAANRILIYSIPAGKLKENSFKLRTNTKHQETPRLDISFYEYGKGIWDAFARLEYNINKYLIGIIDIDNEKETYKYKNSLTNELHDILNKAGAKELCYSLLDEAFNNPIVPLDLEGLKNSMGIYEVYSGDYESIIRRLSDYNDSYNEILLIGLTNGDFKFDKENFLAITRLNGKVEIKYAEYRLPVEKKSMFIAITYSRINDIFYKSLLEFLKPTKLNSNNNSYINNLVESNNVLPSDLFHFVGRTQDRLDTDFNTYNRVSLEDFKNGRAEININSKYEIIKSLIERCQCNSKEFAQRAYMKESTLSTIKNGSGNKINIFKICLAGKCSIEEVYDILNAFSYTFSEYSLVDQILKFCFENEIYDMCVIDELLKENGEAKGLELSSDVKLNEIEELDLKALRKIDFKVNKNAMNERIRSIILKNISCSGYSKESFYRRAEIGKTTFNKLIKKNALESSKIMASRDSLINASLLCQVSAKELDNILADYGYSLSKYSVRDKIIIFYADWVSRKRLCNEKSEIIDSLNNLLKNNI